MAGTGNPFSLGEIQPGERVVDCGSWVFCKGRVHERGRGHVLGQDIDAVGDRIATVVVRPVRLPDLPRLVPEKEHVRSLEPRGQERPPLRIGVRRRPSLSLEPAAPVFVGPAGPWYMPSRSTIIDAASFMVRDSSFELQP
jgi:hypothetical protein